MRRQAQFDCAQEPRRSPRSAVGRRKTCACGSLAQAFRPIFSLYSDALVAIAELRAPNLLVGPLIAQARGG